KLTPYAVGRLKSQKLNCAQQFVLNSVMTRFERIDKALYMRGTDPGSHIHVTHLGPSKFLGLAFHVASEDDLRKFAKAPGASGIENIDEPGGGKRVRVADPHGYQMEVIWGFKPL